MLRAGKYAAAAALVVLGAAVAGAASAEPFKLKGDPKPAYVMFTNVKDGGWTQAHDEARQRMAKELGLEIPYTENIREVASEIRPVAERFIDRGNTIIIGTAFGYSDTFKELAEKYPQVAFLNAAGTTNGANLQSFYGRTYESHYLCGMVAGAMTKSNKIGFVAAHPIPIVNWAVNAYALGAQRMNPAVTVNALFIGTWYDPVKEREAANALVEQGIDVMGIHVDSPATLIAAQEKGVYGTGHHRDMTEFAPKATLCSSVWVWDGWLTPTIKQIAAGTWEPNPYGAFLGIKDGGPDIACCNADVPKDVVDKVMAARQEIVGGRHVFSGPIVDQDGNVKVAEGQAPDDGAMWTMDYLVKGVIGSLK